jgi:hypothetical protein
MPVLGLGRFSLRRQLGIGSGRKEIEPQLQRLFGLRHGRLAGTRLVVDDSQLAGVVPFDSIGPTGPGDPVQLEFKLPFGVGRDGIAPRPVFVHLGEQIAGLGFVGVVEHRRTEVGLTVPDSVEHCQRLAQGAVGLLALDRPGLG